MKTPKIFKRLSIGLAALASGLIISGGVVHAIPYTGDTTQASPVPAFNVFTGNMPAPAPAGGESNFFRGRVPANGNTADPNTPYGDPVNASCTDGQLIQLHIYVHNGASQDANNGGSGPSVAHGTKVKVALPGNQGTKFNSSATISANNAATVSDGLTINCGNDVKLQYVPGSASQFSLGSGELQLSDNIVGSGVPIQSEKVPGDVLGCWNERVYVVLLVKVVKPTPPPKTPAYTCDMLDIFASEDRTVKITKFQTTATNGATFKNAVINWGDNSTPLTTSSVVGQTHKYAKNGTYVIQAVAHFTVNGEDKTATSEACAKQVTFTHNKPPKVVPPPVTPPTVVPPAQPTELVNTGPGTVASLFIGVTLAGVAAHRWMTGRRLSRQ